MEVTMKKILQVFGQVLVVTFVLLLMGCTDNSNGSNRVDAFVLGDCRLDDPDCVLE